MRCDSCKEAFGGVTVGRKCNSHQGGVKGIRKVCQLMDRCARGCWKV